MECQMMHLNALISMRLALLGSSFAFGASLFSMPFPDSTFENRPQIQAFTSPAPLNGANAQRSLRNAHEDNALELAPVHSTHADGESQIRPDGPGHAHQPSERIYHQPPDPRSHPPSPYPAPSPGALVDAHSLHEQFPSRVPPLRLAQVSPHSLRTRTAALLHLHEALRTAPARRLRSHHAALADPAHRLDAQLVRRYRLTRGDMFHMARLDDEEDRVEFARGARREVKALRAAGGAAAGVVVAGVGGTAGIALAADRDQRCRTDPLRWPKSCSWGKWRKNHERALGLRTHGGRPGEA